MTLASRVSVLLAVVALWGPSRVAGQTPWPEDLLRAVMPEATSFGSRGGSPPVVPAFGSDPTSPIGYVFFTSDLPPERRGYSGPIQALVGLDLDGTITGVRIIDYVESHRRTLGDFLRAPGFEDQFAGKTVADAFAVHRDVDGISRATISVRALSRGVRDAARRVADAYLDLEEAPIDDSVDPATLTWLELLRSGFVHQIPLADRNGSAEVSVAHVGTPTFGEYLVGATTFERAQQSIERRGGSDHLFVYGVDGERLRLFQRDAWSVVQGDDTTRLDVDDVYSLGLPNGGVIEGQVVLLGAMIVDSMIDIARPLTFVYDGDGAPEPLDFVYRSIEAREAESVAALMATAGVGAGGGEAAELEIPSGGGTGDRDEPAEVGAGGGSEPGSDGNSTSSVQPQPSEATEATEAAGATDATDATDAGGVREPDPGSLDSVGESGPAPESDAEATLDFRSRSEGSLLRPLVSETDPGRVAGMALVLVLALAAFLVKRAMLRWVSLFVTLGYLGFIDGGFLSITHLMGVIRVGPSAVLSDLPLLMMVTVTLLTTLIWGRVFCGFLCPFGALQDLIDRVIPARFQRELPARWHRIALKWKYVVLVLVLLPPLLGSTLDLYPYFEPFGTVFFLSPSVLLWSIAGAFLVASAVVPRFYCRYACPLGAALAVTSVVSVRRIERVGHCEHCTVCERACPTGAIERERIDFKECVRCNDCEIKLRDRVGVCRHDLEDVRSRLIQIERTRPTGAPHVG